MYRNFFNSTKLATLSILLVTLLLHSGLPVYADFSEDFSGDLSDWTMFARDAASGDYIDHEWDVQDGELINTGTFSSYQEQTYVCQETGYGEGVWSFRLFGPEGRWRFGFRIAAFPAQHTNEYAPNYRPNFNLTQLTVGYDVGPNGESDNRYDFSFSQLRTEPSWLGFYGIGSVNLTQDHIVGWHDYRIEKNSTHIFGFIDGEHVLEAGLRLKTDSYDSICMWTDIGTGVKIDDITIGDFPPDTTSNELPLSDILLFGSIATITVVGVTYTSRSYIKKKD